MKNVLKKLFPLSILLCSTVLISWNTKNYVEHAKHEVPTNTLQSSDDRVIVTESKGTWLEDDNGEYKCQKEGKCYDIVVIGSSNNVVVSGDPEGSLFEVVANPGYSFFVVPNDGTGNEYEVTNFTQTMDGDGIKHLSFN